MSATGKRTIISAAALVCSAMLIAAAALAAAPTQHADAATLKASPKIASTKSAAAHKITVTATWKKSAKPTKLIVRWSGKKGMKGSKSKTFKLSKRASKKGKLTKTLSVKTGGYLYMQVKVCKGKKASKWSKAKKGEAAWKVRFHTDMRSVMGTVKNPNPDRYLTSRGLLFKDAGDTTERVFFAWRLKSTPVGAPTYGDKGIAKGTTGDVDVYPIHKEVQALPDGDGGYKTFYEVTYPGADPVAITEGIPEICRNIAVEKYLLSEGLITDDECKYYDRFEYAL